MVAALRADAAGAGADRGAALGGIDRVEYDQARIVRPAVGIFKAVGIGLLERRGEDAVSEIDAAGRRQNLSPAEMIVDEEAEAQHPGRAHAGLDRQTKRIGRMRCGAMRSITSRSIERFAHQPEPSVLEVAQPAMDELGGSRRRAGGEVVLLDQQDAQPRPAASRAMPLPLRVLLIEQDDLASGFVSLHEDPFIGGCVTSTWMVSGWCANVIRTRGDAARGAHYTADALPYCRSASCWMLRLGLLLYDHLGWRRTLRGPADAASWPRRLAAYAHGFEYSDCWPRPLVLVNAGWRLRGGHRMRPLPLHRRGAGHVLASDSGSAGRRDIATARVLSLNAAGPWIKLFAANVLREPRRCLCGWVRRPHGGAAAIRA